MKETQLKELLRKSSTPLYVFDLAELKRRVQYLRQVLPEKVKLCYAVKANPFILEGLSGLVDRLEICSPGELHICRQLGLPGEQRTRPSPAVDYPGGTHRYLYGGVRDPI